MNITFVPEAWESYCWWQQHDRQQVKRINHLIKAICRDPLSGIGKPEPLKFDLQGYWSRRIDQEHRLTYRLTATELVIIECRYHYSV